MMSSLRGVCLARWRGLSVSLSGLSVAQLRPQYGTFEVTTASTPPTEGVRFEPFIVDLGGPKLEWRALVISPRHLLYRLAT